MIVNDFKLDDVELSGFGGSKQLLESYSKGDVVVNLYLNNGNYEGYVFDRCIEFGGDFGDVMYNVRDNENFGEDKDKFYEWLDNLDKVNYYNAVN